MAQLAPVDTTVKSYLERYPDCAFTYSEEWLRLLSSLYGYQVIPLTATGPTGEITGFVPLCLMRSPLTGQRLVSLPFSDWCPLLAENESSEAMLINQALELAREHKVKYLELRSGKNEALASRSDLAEGNLYVRWLLPLVSDWQSVWAKLRKPVQHQVKKSQKLGVQVRIALQREDMLQYYQLHLQTRTRKHGMPAQPLSYFLSLWDAFAASGTLNVLLAEHQGIVIAGMIVLASGTIMRYAYGASDERFLHLAPNNLLMWTAIKLACERGYATFDMGRTARDNEGLMEFKRRWGAIEEKLTYYYYPQMAGLASTSESSWKFRALTSCWRRLPLPVAGALGGHLYRHLG